MLLNGLIATILGTVLLVAAGLKAVDRTGAALAAGTFGLHGRGARGAPPSLAALEALVAAGLLAGWGPAAWAATAMLSAFAAAQAAAIAAGRTGAPCGCFGARGRISWGSVARTALLAAGAALLALGAAAAMPVALQAAAAGGAVLVAAVLVARAAGSAAPDGALEVATEGPPVGARLELGADAGFAFFTSAGCRLCRSLVESAREMGARVYDEREDPEAWAAAAVPGAPYAVALSADGIVLAKGTVNTRRQLASVLATGRVRGGQARQPEPARSRRGFLASATAAVGAIVAARTAGSLVAPADADAFHICGHTFTTDSCPHPTGIPRVDRRGYPLRGRDGHPVDDLGRPVDARGAPVGPAGKPLLDPDGRALPPTSRTRVCLAAGRRYGLATRTDGTWSRCCDGHVRTIMDCCSTSPKRINGDGSLRGYCYADRRVFCVVYYQSRIPC